MLTSLLAEIVSSSLPGPQMRLYSHQTDTEGRVVACRDRCSLWSMCFYALVRVTPRTSSRCLLALSVFLYLMLVRTLGQDECRVPEHGKTLVECCPSRLVPLCTVFDTKFHQWWTSYDPPPQS
jgi:hypothetical protein